MGNWLKIKRYKFIPSSSQTCLFHLLREPKIRFGVRETGVDGGTGQRGQEGSSMLVIVIKLHVGG